MKARAFIIIFLIIKLEARRCFNTVAKQDLCRRLSFTKPIDAHALQGHVIKNVTLTVGMRNSCKGLCLMDNVCDSFNIGQSVHGDHVVCQLSDSDHSRHPEDLRPREGFTFIGTKNLCSSNPCFHNATCLNGFTNKKYLCHCQSGYTGEHCENGNNIDECSLGSDDCHEFAHCVNTAGSFDCICKIGLTGDGRNCTGLPSCKELHEKNNATGDQAYMLQIGSGMVYMYCHMTGLGACGGGGWTLAMKIDGNKNTFHYNSELWSNEAEYNFPGGITGFDIIETKLPTYSKTSFTKICLGVKIGQQINFIFINQQADSLYSLIADGQYRDTSLGRDTWKSLIGINSSLQLNCNKEGFNVVSTNIRSAKARIGIIGNNEDNCVSCDSRIGFGTGGKHDDSNSCGNEAVLQTDNGNAHIKAMGYIFVQ